METNSAHGRDWVEDFQYENGNYYNICRKCGHGFKGHKRRTICKSCQNTDSSAHRYTDNEKALYNCLILNDYPSIKDEKHYATLVEKQVKTIETRMKAFKYRGDLIICCGNKSSTANAGKALCVVNLYDTQPMTKEHEAAACIEAVAGRVAHMLKDWRFFNRKFQFSKCRVSGSFQSIFQIHLPDDVRIIKPLPILK